MRRVQLLIILLLHSFTFSTDLPSGPYGGGYGGGGIGMGGGFGMGGIGIGFPGVNSDGAPELQDDPMTIEMIAANITFISGNDQEVDVKTAALKKLISMYKLDDSKNQQIFEKSLSRAYEKLAMKDINWNYDEKSGLMKIDGYHEHNRFEDLQKLLDQANVAQPSGYTDAYLLKEARDNSNTPEEYFKELQKRFSPGSDIYA